MADHSSISGYVPTCVERYIRANQLYGCLDPLFLHTLSEQEVIRYIDIAHVPDFCQCMRLAFHLSARFHKIS